jgi:hypothetical protein
MHTGADRVTFVGYEARSDESIPARRMTVEEYRRLSEIGVLGEKVELIEGRIVFGRFPFVFSAEAVAAARGAGVELAEPTLPEKRPRRREWQPSSAAAAAAAATLTREHWQVLERAVLILTQDGGASLPMAASWGAVEDDALDGLNPAAWLERGRDPERLLEVARQDAARRAQ